MLAFKLGALFIRQLTKPVAAQIKHQAQKPGIFRSLCNRYGQMHHKIESRMSLRLLGHSSKKIKDIPEELAVSTGANVLSEAFVFSVAAGLLVYEIQRKSKQDEVAKKEKEAKEQAKEQALNNRFQRIEDQIKSVQEQQQYIYKQYNEWLENNNNNINHNNNNQMSRSLSLYNATLSSDSDAKKHGWWK